jgi:GLPGLI family protein
MPQVMWKIRKIGLLLACVFIATLAKAQKTLSEGSIVYDVSVQTGSDQPQLADMFDGASATLFLKGGLSRSELVSALGSSVTIHDNKTGNGIVLREYGPQKLLIKMNRQNWEDKNKKYEGIKFSKTGDTKTIAGYKCEKAIATLKDGSSFTVYYSEEIIAENKEYDAQFKSLPGLPLEYESSVGKLVVKYAASKVSFDPVPIQKFETPKSGYREMTYEESVKGGSTTH